MSATASRFSGLNVLGGEGGVSLSQILRYHVDRNPDRPFITMHDRSISRRELELSTNRLARAYTKLRVTQNDFVTVGLPNGIEFYQAIFAIWKCGATPHPISWRLPLPEAQAIVDLLKPALVIGGHEQLTGIQRVPEGFEPGPDCSSEPLPQVDARYYKAMSSGGSTGRPKIIVAHKDTIFNPHVTVMGQSVDGTILNIGPLYNNGPFMTSLLAMMTGNHVVLMQRFEPLKTLEMIEQYKVDFFFIVPTMMNRIWKLGAETRRRFDLSCVKSVQNGAAICPVWLKQAWMDWLGAEKFVESYGGTEQQGTTLITGQQWLEHKGSVGRCLPGARIQILDEHGKELPPGEIGEIFFLPDNPEEKTYHYIGGERREVGAAGSVGDMGYLDPDGWLYLADRRVDMIVTGGANVYPAEIEAALDSHPAVSSNIVIGLPDDDLGSVVHAIIHLQANVPAPTQAELVSFLKERIVTYKIPRTFEFVAENLRDDAGKARRTKLRDERIARMQGTSLPQQQVR